MYAECIDADVRRRLARRSLARRTTAAAGDEAGTAIPAPFVASTAAALSTGCAVGADAAGWLGERGVEVL
jgi:hypothetical protein